MIIIVKRFAELDSLRGIAAFLVMSSHLIMLEFYNKSEYYHLLDDTPFRIFWSGHQSVILFFVLSGFVLSLGILSNGIKWNRGTLSLLLKGVVESTYLI